MSPFFFGRDLWTGACSCGNGSWVYRCGCWQQFPTKTPDDKEWVISVLTIRDSRADDVPAIADIYAHWVCHGLASFELEPPDRNEIGRRRLAMLVGGYPHLVAEDATGAVLGYAYADSYRTRPAYRFSVEDSVYVAPVINRRGVGRTLLSELLARFELGGWRQVVAVIGDSDNTPSIGLHRALGFQFAGVLPAVGWRHNRWVDSVLVTRPLGAGADAAPSDGLS